MERNSSDDENAKKPQRKLAGAAVLQESVTTALHRALFEEWAETGYASLRMERIATRASVGKAALYRRWKTKREFAYDAVRATALTITPIPDTGTLRGDVDAITLTFSIALRHPLVRRILPDLHAEHARSDELADLLKSVTKERRAQALIVLERAVGRGELPSEVDYQQALDMLIAPLYWRIIVQKGHPSKSEIHQIAKIVFASIQGTLS
jgi:AcrR family transcriptional regulator